MTVDEYLSGIAQQLVHELEPILKVKEVTTNSVLLGAYTEAAVRRLIHTTALLGRRAIPAPSPALLRKVLPGVDHREGKAHCDAELPKRGTPLP